MLEELLALGHAGAEYDAWLINIGDGNQFGSGFVAINPNSKIPALLDRSTPKPTRVFESGAILLYLAERFGAFLPSDVSDRAECLSWLFWQMGSAPYLGGGFGHFYAYAPIKLQYPIDRYAMEVKPLPTWRPTPGTAPWCCTTSMALPSFSMSRATPMWSAGPARSRRVQPCSAVAG